MGPGVTVPLAVTYSASQPRSLFPVPSSFAPLSFLFLSRARFSVKRSSNARRQGLPSPGPWDFYPADPGRRTRRRLITRPVMKASSSRAEVLSCSREPKPLLFFPRFYAGKQPVSENGVSPFQSAPSKIGQTTSESTNFQANASYECDRASRPPGERSVR